MTQITPTPLLSIIVPMHNEADGLGLFFSRLTPVLEAITPDWEIVCVDDGSKDATLAGLQAIHQREPRVKAISFSRNFGKEAAMTAGLAHVAGQAVIPIDADLQDPPELVTEMVAKWREGYKVVTATRRTRAGDGGLKRLTAHLFYKLIGKMSPVQVPANTGDFRLIDREVVTAMLALPERTRFMKGLFAWVGFPTTQILFDRPERAHGTTKFNFTRLWNFALDGIFSFSTAPLKIWTYLGALVAGCSFLYAVYLIVRTLMHGVDVPGYASIMTAVLFMGGVQLISLGIIGEYIARIYNETKQRPLYIVQQRIGVE